ncbi:HTH_38 domain-containing protein [Trichonephila clavipes]|nr:HTH_38 domain-containing protein [Trichonephila clavipes]
MIRPILNSHSCEKCLLARLPGMFRLPKSSFNRWVIVTFMNLRICAGLCSTLFLIVVPPRPDALRRNRRQYEQLTDFDRGRIIGLREAGWSNRRIGRHLGRSDMVVARCWQQWITEGRVYRRGSGRPRNTNDREDRAIRRVATGTNNVASIDSTPLTSFQTSSAIKRNHKETTDRSWRGADVR